LRVNTEKAGQKVVRAFSPPPVCAFLCGGESEERFTRRQRERERERERDRQTDRQTDRHTHTHTHREREREREREVR